MTLGTHTGWILAIVLAGINLSLAISGSQQQAAETTYVLTPIVDVIPQGAPLESSEVEALMASLRTPQDPSNVQDAYATLGSTLTLHDLLRGVSSLASTQVPLTPSQSEAISATLEAAEADHAALVEVQEKILALEAKLGRDVNRIMMRLPAEDRTRIAAAIGGRQ